MSRNSKNARLIKEARERSANRVAQQKSGVEKKPHAQGRAAAPKHKKKNAWWQRKVPYAQFIKGGAKASRKTTSDTAGGSADPEAD